MNIEIGQKWRDLDKRMHGRVREIVDLVIGVDGEVIQAIYLNGKQRIRISVRRLRHPFFELVP